MRIGSHWTSRWWGGRLSDGTEIVVNPKNPATAIFDLTDENGQAPAQMHQPKPDSVRSWLSDRSSQPAQRMRGSLGAAPSRGALLASAGVLMVPLAILLLSSITDAAMLFLAVVAGLGLSRLVLTKDTKRSGKDQAANVHPGDDPHLAPLRYVPEAVSASTPWRRMTDRADEITAEDARAEEVLNRLWKGAGVDVYLEDGSLHSRGRVLLEQLAHQVDQIMWQRPDRTGTEGV